MSSEPLLETTREIYKFAWDFKMGNIIFIQCKGNNVILVRVSYKLVASMNYFDSK
jgi:hypothetical protein